MGRVKDFLKGKGLSWEDVHETELFVAFATGFVVACVLLIIINLI